MKIDDFDRKILGTLQENGALNNQELASQIGLSPSPCLRRVRQLEDAGIIRRTVDVDAKALGLHLTVLIHIRMDRHTRDRFDAFESIVQTYPEVQECALITGQEADYQLKVLVPDMDEYQRFLLNKITKIKGVEGVHSSFVLRKAVDTRRVPLKYVPG